MSPVIAFDIAVVAQKVKVQLLYNGRHAKSEKVGGVLDHQQVGMAIRAPDGANNDGNDDDNGNDNEDLPTAVHRTPHAPNYGRSWLRRWRQARLQFSDSFSSD